MQSKFSIAYAPDACCVKSVYWTWYTGHSVHFDCLGISTSLYTLCSTSLASPSSSPSPCSSQSRTSGTTRYSMSHKLCLIFMYSYLGIFDTKYWTGNSNTGFKVSNLVLTLILIAGGGGFFLFVFSIHTKNYKGKKKLSFDPKKHAVFIRSYSLKVKIKKKKQAENLKPLFLLS